MNFLQQKRFLIWIIVFLLVFNISAGIAILFHVLGENPEQAENVQSDYLQKELNLNKDQTLGLGKIRKEFNFLSKDVTGKITEIRSQLVHEMERNNPDTLRIRELTNQLGRLQGDLNYQIAMRYLGIREICTPEQALKLNSAYQYLFGLENQPQQHNRGFRFRHGRTEQGKR